MKRDIKLLALAFLILTIELEAKNTPIKSNIIVNPYIKNRENIKIKNINLLKPASIPIDDNIDYRKVFSILFKLTL